MKKSTSERLTLATAVIGAVTGIFALAWQIRDSRLGRAENLSVMASPVLVFEPAESIGFTATITNHSTNDVFLRTVRLEFDEKLLEQKRKAGAEIWSGAFVDLNSHVAITEPLRPRESRSYRLQPEEIREPNFVEKLGAVPSVVKVTTSTGSEFLCADYAKQLSDTIGALEFTRSVRRKNQ